jgi:hypothetical protein
VIKGHLEGLLAAWQEHGAEILRDWHAQRRPWAERKLGPLATGGPRSGNGHVVHDKTQQQPIKEHEEMAKSSVNPHLPRPPQGTNSNQSTNSPQSPVEGGTHVKNVVNQQHANQSAAAPPPRSDENDG